MVVEQRSDRSKVTYLINLETKFVYYFLSYLHYILSLHRANQVQSRMIQMTLLDHEIERFGQSHLCRY